jgi:hypothetical protein
MDSSNQSSNNGGHIYAQTKSQLSHRYPYILQLTLRSFLRRTRNVVGHVLAGDRARRGVRIVVVDRHTQANGVLGPNFGFVTVTGQGRQIHSEP